MQLLAVVGIVREPLFDLPALVRRELAVEICDELFEHRRGWLMWGVVECGHEGMRDGGLAFGGDGGVGVGTDGGAVDFCATIEVWLQGFLEVAAGPGKKRFDSLRR